MITGTCITAGTAPAAPIEQAEHLHDFHDLWHATISSTPREMQLLDLRSFLHAEPPGNCRCTRTPLSKHEYDECNCGIATVFSQTAPGSCWTCTTGRRTPDSWTAAGESQWSAGMHHGKRPLRHDSVVDDLDMHNSGRVSKQSKNAQFDTVRTCLCSMTAISTTLLMN